MSRRSSSCTSVAQAETENGTNLDSSCPLSNAGGMVCRLPELNDHWVVLFFFFFLTEHKNVESLICAPMCMWNNFTFKEAN